MRLARIRLENVRNLTGEFTLAGRTLILGANGAGKTTLLNAILLGIEGCGPNGKKRTIDMCRRGETKMGVGLDFERADGSTFTIERNIDCSGAMPSSEVEVSPSRGERTQAQREARIQAELGAATGALDLSKFLDLSPAKKAEFLGPMLAGRGAPITVDDFLAALWLAEAPIDDPDSLAKVRAAWRPADSAQENCARVATLLKDLLSEATAAERQVEVELPNLRRTIAEKDATPGTATSLRAERDGLSREIEVLTGELSADSARIEGLRRAQAQAERAQEALAKARAERDAAAAALATFDADGATPDAEHLATERAGLVDPAEIEPPAIYQPSAAVMERVRDLTAQADVLSAEIEAYRTPTVPSTDPEIMLVRVAEAEVERAKASPWREVEEIAGRVIKVYSDNDCFLDDPDRLRVLAREHGGDLSAKEAALAQAKDKLGAARERTATAVSERDAAEAAQAERINRRGALRLEAAQTKKAEDEATADANRKAREGWRAAVDARSAEVARLAARRGEIDQILGRASKRQDLASRLAAREAAVDAAQEAASRVQLDTAEAPEPVDRADLERRIASLRAQVVAIEARIAAKDGVRALNDRLIELEAKSERGKTRSKALRATVRAAGGVSSEIIGKTFAPLLDAASDLLRRVNPQFGIEATFDGGIELFARTGPGPTAIAWGELSRGQSLVFGAALTLALIRLGAPRFACLPLDVAEIDEHNLPRLLGALEAMGGDFGTILVATCHGPETVPPGWGSILLAKVEAGVPKFAIGAGA